MLLDVDSGVVRLDIRPDQLASSEGLPHFQWIVRAALGQRRRTLLKAFRAAGISIEALGVLNNKDVKGHICLGGRGQSIASGRFKKIRLPARRQGTPLAAFFNKPTHYPAVIGYEVSQGFPLDSLTV